MTWLAYPETTDVYNSGKKLPLLLLAVDPLQPGSGEIQALVETPGQQLYRPPLPEAAVMA